MGILFFLILLFIGAVIYLIHKVRQEDRIYNHFNENQDYPYYEDDFDSGTSSYTTKSNTPHSHLDFDPYSQDPSRSMYLDEDGDIIEDL